MSVVPDDPKTSRNADLLAYGAEFAGATPLTNHQVYQELKRFKSDDPLSAPRALTRSTTDTLEYCDQFRQTKDDAQATDKLKFLSRHDLSRLEVVSLCNFMPRSLEEAKTIIPTLQHFGDFELQGILEELTSSAAGNADNSDSDFN